MCRVVAVALLTLYCTEPSEGIGIRLYANYVSIIIVLVNVGFVKGLVVFSDDLGVDKKRKRAYPKIGSRKVISV